MKVLQIIGALLIAAGLYVLIQGASYPSDKSLFKVGGVEAKVEEHHAVPPWVGGVGSLDSRWTAQLHARSRSRCNCPCAAWNLASAWGSLTSSGVA